MKWINLHTHKPLPENQTGLVSHPAQCEFLPLPGQLYSVGLHPWDITEASTNEWLQQVALLSAHPQVLAIGECGLDRLIDTPLRQQQAAFIQQVEMAEQQQKPLIIHAVRSYADLLHLKKGLHSQLPWILHGYNGHPETTRQLIRQGFYFSVGPSLLKNNEQLNQSLRLVPAQHLFIETDENPVNPESIYIFAASIRGCTTEELQSQIWENFQRIFNQSEHVR